ncbi:PAS domain-containing sensor histidine kinase [Candidatus Azambacteria bacterium]|nr:PAS domain-containing sensor histidine kinase [Candidatus Azambacteria bacterium]
MENVDDELKNILRDTSKLSSIIENSFDGIVITDKEGVIRYVNKAWEKMTGWTREEVIGKVTPRILKSGEKSQEFYENLWKTITSGGVARAEIQDKRKDGALYDTDEIIMPVKGGAGEIVGYAGFQRDITDRKKIDRMKTEFISVASHQLRTPMTTIRLFVELLSSEDFGELNKDQKEHVGEIYKATKRMIALLNDLLDVSRADSGKLKINRESVDVEELVQSILEETKLITKSKHCGIHFDVPGQKLPNTYTDPHLLRQIFRNLLDNAVNYSNVDLCRISLKLGTEDGFIKVGITDSGIGISDSDKERIFTRFFRAENAVRISPDGTGLGLHVVKNIAELLGGRVWFESELGKGSTFYFTIPISVE